MKWVLVALVILGDWLIIGKNKYGFLLWLFCDGAFCIYSLLDSNYPEAAVFGIYAIMGILGYRRWNEGS